MYIDMKKIQEDTTFVYYRLEEGVYEEQYKNKEQKKPTYKRVIKYGYCKFNKKTEEFELDQEKTDQHFFEKGKDIVKVARLLLLSYKRKNLDFPDEIYRAYG